MKILLCSLVALALSAGSLIAQESSVREETFAVAGNCSMCKTRIEKAVALDEVKFARWNKKTKILSVAFESPAMTVDSLQKRIAAVGHDTGPYHAPDSVYAVLPACCLYRDNAKTH